MKKYIFGAIIIVAIALGFTLRSNPIDTCPPQVQKIALEFAKHAESKIVEAEFMKTDVSLSGNVIRHYYDVTFQQDSTSHVRRIVLPVDRGTVCPAHFIN